jgi:hypothetical protein
MKWEVMESVKLKRNGTYWVWGSLHDWKFPSERIKKSEQSTVRTTQLFLVTLQSAVLLVKSKLTVK